MTTILVTGSNGQLGICLKDIAENDLNILYTDYQELDICDLNKVTQFFQSHSKIDYCINCAAYTAVDKAEEDYDKAYQINAMGAKNLALACKSKHTTLIHVSTDFVFDGLKTEAYSETDETKPVNVYGKTKLKGEIEIKQILKTHFILRTSWLYSEHGNNFMKTMLRLSKDRNKISVVSDQIGTPTYAGDLAKVIFHIINIESQNYGLYHYSNLGEISWFDFAKAIFKESKIDVELLPIKTKDYPTLAKRPVYSVLDKSKIIKTFNVEIPYWKNSLKKSLFRLHEAQ
ncbi:dTDP-4-dehydrorhamnose reductase [Mariniflexile sp.]|uniref:dTDP-4-dehydrorhamnose reductase n=1 Tax=Mariniflexile sp. TaxID=1979402 RepID=UPI0040473FB4